jgi:TorA maturation chaperone TorD
MARLYTPIGAPTLDKDGVAHEPTPEEQDAQKKEIAAVALANQEKYDEAFAALTAIIDSVPTYGSAYNNRCAIFPCPSP